MLNGDHAPRISHRHQAAKAHRCGWREACNAKRQRQNRKREEFARATICRSHRVPTRTTRTTNAVTFPTLKAPHLIRSLK